MEFERVLQGQRERVPREGAWLDYADNEARGGRRWTIPFPWGAPGWDEAGAAAPAVGLRLDELTPAFTPALLNLAGALDVPADWLTERGRRRPWNDAWGSPLVVGLAFYQPKRNTTLDLTGYINTHGGAVNAGVIRGDSHLILAQDRFTSVRSFYVAPAAPGPVLRTPLAADATAAALSTWTQVTEVCRAAEWTERSFATPPWRGVRRMRLGEETCFLAAPIEIR